MLDILSDWIVPVFMRDVKKGSVPGQGNRK
jgi:hypothetical protein